MSHPTPQRISGTLHLRRNLHVSAAEASQDVAAQNAFDHKVPDHVDTAYEPRKTVDLSHPAPPGELNLPHERDEHVGMTGGVPSKHVQQAARDVQNGLKDTSRSTEANAAYEKLKNS